MPDNKEKDLPLFSDDLPKEPEKVAEPQYAPAEETAVATDTMPPVVDETFSAPKDIFEAIQRKDLDAVVGFLEKRANLAATNEDERTPLQIAAGLGTHDIVKLLVECGSNIEAKGKDGRTSLMLALSNCHFEIADYLLSKGAAVNVASATNYTPLMQAAAKGATDIVREILPKIDNINAKNNEGRTALMIAVRFGHRDIIDLLLGRNASLLLADNNGNTAVSLAETPDLKKYLTEKVEEEKAAAEERQKGKEETIAQEVKRHYPSIFIVIGIILVAAAAGYFSYYQIQKVQIRQVVIPPALQQAAGAIAAAYCERMTECREKTSTDFKKRCITQTSTSFGQFLSEQEGDKCDQNRINTCAGCLRGVPCDRILKLEFDYLENHCISCFKACEPQK